MFLTNFAPVGCAQNDTFKRIVFSTVVYSTQQHVCESLCFSVVMAELRKGSDAAVPSEPQTACVSKEIDTGGDSFENIITYSTFLMGKPSC